MAPHCVQLPGSLCAATRVPQCPQKGRPGATELPHRTHAGPPPDMRVAGTPLELNGDGLGGDAMAAGELDGAVCTGCAWLPDALGAYAGPTRAADGFIGLPQSMQKRDSDSFSRPQKAHDVTRWPPAGKLPWGANIGRRAGGGQ